MILRDYQQETVDLILFLGYYYYATTKQDESYY